MCFGLRWQQRAGGFVTGAEAPRVASQTPPPSPLCRGFQGASCRVVLTCRCHEGRRLPPTDAEMGRGHLVGKHLPCAWHMTRWSHTLHRGGMKQQSKGRTGGGVWAPTSGAGQSWALNSGCLLRGPGERSLSQVPPHSVPAPGAPASPRESWPYPRPGCRPFDCPSHGHASWTPARDWVGTGNAYL